MGADQERKIPRFLTWIASSLFVLALVYVALSGPALCLSIRNPEKYRAPVYSIYEPYYRFVEDHPRGLMPLMRYLVYWHNRAHEVNASRPNNQQSNP
jgi:hypothetical protein